MPFTPGERSALLELQGVGPTVIARFEQMGLDSMRLLAEADSGDILGAGAVLTGSTCWNNSPRARAAVESAIALAKSRHAGIR